MSLALSMAVLGVVHVGHFGHVGHIGHVGQSICPLAVVGRLPSWSVGGWQGLRVDPLTCTTQPHNAHRHQGNVLKMWGPQATSGILSIPEYNFGKTLLRCRKLRIWFHFPKILCQPLFLNYAKHISHCSGHVKSSKQKKWLSHFLEVERHKCTWR